MRDKKGRFIKGHPIIKGSEKGWFKKEKPSWNKDTKGVMKSNKTSFKKGQIPFNKGTKGLIKPNKGNFKKNQIPWNKGKKGLPSWNKGKKYPAITGNKNPNWKGGISKQKYILIKSPNHPYKDKKGYVPKHRLVMEKHIGRYLKRTEIVHHIDENKYNNHINNLMLFPSKTAHIKYHWLQRKLK